MRCRRLALALLVSLLFPHSITMRAGVLAINVSPPSPIVNQPATVSVTGQDPCGAVLIDFGDGVAQTYPLAGLPFSTQHTWTTAGSKTVTATGQGNCTGQATLTVQVTQSSVIAQLCARVNCGEPPKLFALKPEITSISGSNTPGGIVAIAGKNFGTTPGAVVATLRTWSGGPIQPTLEVTEWTNTIVAVRWPADIRGVRHQSGSVALTTAIGRKRDYQRVTFSPELDVKTLPLADVQLLTCGNDSNLDICNNVKDPDDIWFDASTPMDSFYASHFNVWGAVGNDKGTDGYRIVLKNDWAMESFNWSVSVDSGEGFAFKPTGFTKGASWSPSVTWLVTPNDTISYLGIVTIAGPVGVPHK